MISLINRKIIQKSTCDYTNKCSIIMPTVQLGIFMFIVEVQWGKEWFEYLTLRHTLVTHCLRQAQFDKAGVAFLHTLKPLNQWRSNQWISNGGKSWSWRSLIKPLEEQFIFSIDLVRNLDSKHYWEP